MSIQLDTLSTVTLDVAWRVGFEGETVSLAEPARKRILDGRAGFERLLASGKAGFVYGSTVAPGARAKSRLTDERQGEFVRSQNAWAPKAFGGGNKWVPERAVRLTLLARLAGYLEGHGRLRLETAEWVASLLERPMPQMPLDAATGPGEVMPLSWLYPDLSDVDLQAGEVMPLYNGSPCASAFVADVALTSKRRMRLFERICALLIEASAAPLDAYDPALIEIVADKHHKDILTRLNEYLVGVPTDGRLSHQAPVSWRIIPTVLATISKAVQGACEAAEESLQSVAHNPVYLPPTPEYPDGRAVSPGGFHNHQAARAIDLVNIANADMAALVTKHSSRLLDGTPFGLPKLLVDPESGIIGTEFLAWSQTSNAERARHASSPSVLSTGLEDPGGGQSDVASPVFLSYERFLDTTDAVDAALANLVVAIVQAYRLNKRKPPAALAELAAFFDDQVSPIELDRIGELGESVRRLKNAISDSVEGRGVLADLA